MDTEIFLMDLDAGIFANKVGKAVMTAATGAVNTGKKGQVVITLDFDRIGDSRQVMVKHKLAFTEPTQRGKAGEEETTETPMYLNQDGTVTIFPVAQDDMFQPKENADG